MADNIYLVGFMGTGKSSVGEALAKRQNKEFIDLDTLIESEYGRKISDIFAQEGESFFRKIETKILQQVSRKNGVVVACGGGIVIIKGNIRIMKETGRIFCLTADPKVILERTKGSCQRPLLNVADPKRQIELLLEKRAIFYGLADETIDTSGLSIIEVVEKIIKSVSKQKRNGMINKFLLSVIFACIFVFHNFACVSYAQYEDEEEAGGEQIPVGNPKILNKNLGLTLTYISKADDFAREGYFDEAIEYYNKAIKANRNIPDTYFKRGKAYLAMNNFVRALNDLNKAIERNPYYTSAYKVRAEVYLKQNEFELALSDSNKVIGVNPSDPEGYRLRSLAYLELGLSKQAISDINQAIRVSSRNNILNSYISSLKIYFRLGDYDKCWQAVRKIEGSGGKVNPEFYRDLQRLSGRQN